MLFHGASGTVGLLGLPSHSQAGLTTPHYPPAHWLEAGSVSLLERLLQLLDSPSEEPESGMGMHVAACCSGLVQCTYLPQFNGEMVRLLARAITITAGVSIHSCTYTAAFREAVYHGRSSIVGALLEGGPPQKSINAALHHAVKTPHADVVEQLIAGGANIGRNVKWAAFSCACPSVVRPVVEAMRRSGAWNLDTADEAINLLLGSCNNSYIDPGPELNQRATTLRMLISEFNADPAAHGSSSLAVACARKAPFHLLAELLLLMGADADEALMTLCNSEPENDPLLRRYQHRHADGVAGLLAIGSESPEGASQAAGAALERGRMVQARVLLESGAVSSAACEALLLRALGTAAAVPQDGHGEGAGAAGAGAGDEQEEPADADVGNGVAAVEGQRRWDWVWELARSGTLQQSAVELALEEACRRGDAEAVQELASMGLAGSESCTAAFWLAFEGGHVDCMQQLRVLGAMTVDVLQEAVRVTAAREALRSWQQRNA
ncbi:hypothetical protein Vretifemale_4259 [Volvox reticuliferus]|uniref:Ankyrin repeat protein n=1 Tax=Volvox reticuliferus TaxID=1737510 RepID=A0A8J4C466_9CHLO|nr:hypothetical protein Vretifemale_4259 [Volvox reticuliferus]